MAELISNTSAEYKCIQCGSSSVSVIAQKPDPRLKCNNCSMMFDGSQAKAAAAAGAIPEQGLQNTEALQADRGLKDVPEVERRQIATTGGKAASTAKDPERKTSIPRKPDFVLISADRRRVEYVTDKKLKQTLLKWEGQEIKYQLFSLVEKKAEVKVEFDAS